MVKKDKIYEIPAVLSLFFPGMGQAVKKQWSKAIGMWVCLFMCILLSFAFIGLFLLPLLWIWAVYDAYNGQV